MAQQVVPSSGHDLLPLPTGRFVVLELNGAVEFDTTYSLDGVDP